VTDLQATPASTTPDAEGSAANHPKTDAPSAASAAEAKKAAAAAKRAAKKATSAGAAKPPSQKKTANKAASKASDAQKSDAKKATDGAAAEAPEARSAAEIKADIDAAQTRLAASVDELSDRLNPQYLAEEAVTGVKRVFLNEDGSPKGKPIAIVAGSVTALLLLRKIFHRG